MQKHLFWASFFILLCTIFYCIFDVIAPFAIAFICAYLLQPASCFLSSTFRIKRRSANVIIFLVFTSIFLSIAIFATPFIYEQIFVFIKQIPQYKHNIENRINIIIHSADSMDPFISEKFANVFKNILDSFFSIISSFANHMWQYTLATINIFVIIALVPFLLFYFLRDWRAIINKIESFFPMKEKEQIKIIFVKIDKLLAAYIRGQLNICLFLSFYYVAGLYFIGIDFPLLLGIFSGFLIIIPFVGAITSLITILISCYFSYGTGTEMIYCIALFSIGHFVEAYILAPKIIGDKIGLHPVWIVFSVLVAGSLFGIIGIIFAIPVAGIIKILLEYAIERYKTSSIYNK